MPRAKPGVILLGVLGVVLLGAPDGASSPAARAAESRPDPGGDDTPPHAREMGTLRTIVLDPGHGGEEVGAVGRSGAFEKDLALDIAKRVADRLTRHLGINVVLTREEDRVVPLRERTAIANHARADLFLSIHLNSSRRASAHGTETYFLALTATDEEALSLARTENLGTGVPAPEAAPAEGEASAPAGDPEETGPSGASELDLVLWEMAQSEHLVRSSRFAEMIQDEMNRLLGVDSRGIKQAPFTVLMGATMPAVLVEVAFLSNESEERSLASPEFRDKVAEALESAIARFKDDSERALSAVPSARSER